MGVESPEGGATRIFGNEAFRRGWTTAEEGAFSTGIGIPPHEILGLIST